jgi:hypothetical protein
MAAPTPTTRQQTAPVAVATRPGRWIDDWRPEDPAFWESTGKPVARRNLFFSVFSEHIGFSIWSLWSVLVLFLPEAVYGIDPAGKFLLTTLPTALGAFVRLPYTSPSPSSAAATGRSSAPRCCWCPRSPRRRPRARRRLHDPARRQLPGRCRWRQLRQLHGQHQRLLPEPAQGLGARPQRRRRQPRRPVVQLVGLLVLATAGASTRRLVCWSTSR